MDDTLKEEFSKIKESDKEAKALEKPAVIGNPDEKTLKAPIIADETTQKDTPAPVEKPKKTAPTTWRTETKAKWDTLPPEVQDEIEKREADMEKGWKDLGGRSNELKQWDEAIAPYRATLGAIGMAPQKAVQVLFNADHLLRYGNPQQKALGIHCER